MDSQNPAVPISREAFMAWMNTFCGEQTMGAIRKALK